MLFEERKVTALRKFGNKTTDNKENSGVTRRHKIKK
jgi:hypothetical protein